MTQPGRLPLSVPPCAMRWNWSRYERNWSQWSRRRCCQRMSRCGYVHLNQMENARSLGRAILPLHERGKNRMRFPSRSSKQAHLMWGRAFLALPDNFPATLVCSRFAKSCGTPDDEGHRKPGLAHQGRSDFQAALTECASHSRQRLLTDVEYRRVFSKVLIRGGLRSNRPGSDGSPWWVALQDYLREALLETPGKLKAGQTPCSPLRSHKNASE